MQNPTGYRGCGHSARPWRAARRLCSFGRAPACVTRDSRVYLRDRNRIRLVASANATIIASVIRELDRVCPDACDPREQMVDVLSRIAIDTASWPAHLILGCVTVLDGAGLRHRLVKAPQRRHASLFTST